MADRGGRQVVLVDEQDREVGLMGIWEAHKNPGVLHRATSVLLYDDKGRVLLQKRSKAKPLWPQYWSNTFCTNTPPGLGHLECATVRGKEELGLELKKKKLRVLYRLYYQADYNEELSEHEVTSVVVGEYEGRVEPNPEEAEDIWRIGWEDLLREIKREPEKFSPWFKLMADDTRVRELFE